VRNHGRVPRIDAAQHRLLLRVPSPGGVRAHKFSMDALRAMPSRSIAVTLACAGLRRKEAAMVAPVDGFNRGAASLGTCVWTGVPLAHVLRGAGVTEPSDEMQFVCFAGVQSCTGRNAARRRRHIRHQHPAVGCAGPRRRRAAGV
jgi:DMSO/TMAO reductase YedYZ molybdopterin-dependent catalytic subunit